MPTNPLYSVCLPTVLIADNDAETGELLRLYLSRARIRVLFARSEPQCLDLTLRKLVDIVLLDVMMSAIRGVETCAALRARPATRQLPVLFLTVRDDSATRVTGNVTWWL